MTHVRDLKQRPNMFTTALETSISFFFLQATDVEILNFVPPHILRTLLLAWNSKMPPMIPYGITVWLFSGITQYKWLYEDHKFYYLNCKERYEDMIDHRSYIYTTKQFVKLKPEKNLGLKEARIQTHDLQYWCSALPTELSS